MHVLGISFDPTNQQFMVKWLENRDGGYASVPVNETTLVEKDNSDYTYELDEANRILMYAEKGVVEKKWKKLAAITYPIKHFEGSYYSPEVEHKVDVKVRDQHLSAENPFLNSLIRIGNTVFLDQETLAIVKFELGAGSRITGFLINIPRGDRSLRNFPFYKHGI